MAKERRTVVVLPRQLAAAEAGRFLTERYGSRVECDGGDYKLRVPARMAPAVLAGLTTDGRALMCIQRAYLA